MHNSLTWPVTYSATIQESKWITEPILQCIAEDKDGPENAKVRYYFSSNIEKEISEYFTIDSQTGYLFLRKPLDYELKSKYSFKIIATDTMEEVRPNSYFRGALSSSPIHTATAQISITVADINDEAPEIEVDYLISDLLTSTSKKFAIVKENLLPPQFIASILVTDRDAGLNGQVNCFQQMVITPNTWTSLTSTTNASLISQFTLENIRQSDGLVQYSLLTSEALDREDTANGGSFRQVKIFCRDSGSAPKSTSTYINIKVSDENDNSPKIHFRNSPDIQLTLNGWSSHEGWPFVSENAPIGTLIMRVNATDPDEDQNGRLSFSLEPQSTIDSVDSTSLFQIDSVTGDITTKEEIDREAFEPPLTAVVLRVKVSDNGSPPKSITQDLQIHIRDENDNNPVFQQAEYKFNILENLPGGYPIGEITVTDKDSDNIKLSFGIQSYGTLPFLIWTNSIHCSDVTTTCIRFLLNTTRPLDRETEEKFKFVVLATDGLSSMSANNPRLRANTASTIVEISVDNENDNDPVIIFPQKQNKTFHLSSRERKNFELLTINANDKDSSENIHVYELLGVQTGKNIDDAVNNSLIHKNSTQNSQLKSEKQPFLAIEPKTGILFLTRDMRSDDKGVHTFVVKVTDSGVPPRSSTIMLFVSVDESSPRSVVAETRANNIENRNDPLPYFGKRLTPVIDGGISGPAKVIRSNHASEKKSAVEKNGKTSYQIAGDMVILLALGLVFLLLISTLSLVAYMRYWTRCKRGPKSAPGETSNSLLFTNQVNGETCLRAIHSPSVCNATLSKQVPDHLLCTLDGSIIRLSTNLLDEDALKSSFNSALISDRNYYYKATDPIKSPSINNCQGYSSLSPLSAVLLKSSQKHDFTNTIGQTLSRLPDHELNYIQNERCSQRQNDEFSFSLNSVEGEEVNDADVGPFHNPRKIKCNPSTSPLIENTTNFHQWTTENEISSAEYQAESKDILAKSRFTESNRNVEEQLIDLQSNNAKSFSDLSFVSNGRAKYCIQSPNQSNLNSPTYNVFYSHDDSISYPVSNKYAHLYQNSAEKLKFSQSSTSGPVSKPTPKRQNGTKNDNYSLARSDELRAATNVKSHSAQSDAKDYSVANKSSLMHKSNLKHLRDKSETAENPWTSYV